jgi:hypothetical protein
MNLKAVYGVYKEKKEVERAIDALTDDGFLNKDISVLMPENGSKASEESAVGASADANLGGLAGELMGLGMPEFEAKRYESYVKNGGLLLSVHSLTSEQVDHAIDCLVSTGANDVTSTTEKRPDENSYRTQTLKMENEGGSISPFAII